MSHDVPSSVDLHLLLCHWCNRGVGHCHPQSTCTVQNLGSYCLCERP